MARPQLPPMPTLDQQIDMLAATGDQFQREERQACRVPIAGVYLGDEQALYDARVVPQIPHLVVSAAEVHEALFAARPAGSLTATGADTAISSLMASEGLIVGFSGYGTGDGRDYQVEREAMEQLFEHWASADAAVPVSAVVDGGTGYGVPGLSGALAQKYGFPTVGFASLRGLRGAAPRETFVVTGQEFGDEAEALGTAPDVLLVLGGGPNAEKEVFASMAAGSLVVPVVLKKYPENSVAYLAQRNSDVAEASLSSQFSICNDVLSVIITLETIGLESIRKARNIRGRYLASLLSS